MLSVGEFKLCLKVSQNSTKGHEETQRDTKIRWQNWELIFFLITHNVEYFHEGI
jgi:hypothetical protein